MPLHYIAWKKALAEWNCPFEEELFYSWGGRPVREIITALNEMHGLAMPVDSVAKRKESLYFELEDQLKAIPDVIEHIEAKHGHIPLAVVSGSRRTSVLHSCRRLGWLRNLTCWYARKIMPAESHLRLLSESRRATGCSARRLPGV